MKKKIKPWPIWKITFLNRETKEPVESWNMKGPTISSAARILRSKNAAFAAMIESEDEDLIVNIRAISGSAL